MSVRAWWARLRASVRRTQVDAEMEREMAFHVDMATRRNEERGMSPAAARRQAQLAFGSREAHREFAREAGRAMAAEHVAADIRFALRGLRRAPTFAVAAILTLALGIGASTAIFTVVDTVLLRPLPVPHPEDFTYVGWQWAKGGAIPSLTAYQYEFVRDHNRSFDAIATYRTDEARLGDAASPGATIRGLHVSSGFFRTMGFAPRIGREFDARELAPSGPAVVILGDGTWRSRFGADPAIVGQQVQLAGQSRTVVGVMPPEFPFPPAIGYEGYLVPLPVRADPADEGHNSDAVGRLRHGIGSAAVAADLRALTEAFRTENPALAAPGESFRLFTHADVFASGVRPTIWILFGAVSLLLLIACANTVTLVLVRGAARQPEMAVRASIGASRARIVQQLLTEGMVLSAIATTLGVAIGGVALRAFLAAAPNALPAGMQPTLDGRVLAYAIAVSVATAFVFGLAAAAPVFRVSRQAGLLRTRTHSTGTRAREALVMLEMAPAVMLLAGATMLIASFARLVRVDPGFDADRVVAVRLGNLPESYDGARRDVLVDRMLDRVRSLPGVEAAAAAPSLPLERGLNFSVDTREHPERGVGAAELRFVSPDYFATLGAPLIAGRDFGPGDAAGSEPVAIVNAALARRFWGGDSPLGHTIRIGHFNDRWIPSRMAREARVVGVAADMREMGLDRVPRPTVLVPRTQSGNGTPVLLVRGTPAAIAPVLRREVVAVAPELTPTIESMSAVVSRSVAGPRFRTLLIGAFAGAALLLAGIGIYGAIAAIVQQRTREIGIRLALGAPRSSVALGAMRRCLVWAAAGTVVGLVAFWQLRRVLTAMLYGTSAGDPWMLGTALAVLAAAAALAAWIPARRATRIDPAIALRLE